MLHLLYLRFDEGRLDRRCLLSAFDEVTVGSSADKRSVPESGH